MEGVLYYEQLKTAKDAAKVEHDQIRQQQVQLRLQENQNQLARMQQLRKVLAAEEVQFGTRNIAPTSGTIRAITEQNFVNYMQDETAERLNFMAKRQNLNIEDRMVNVRKRAAYIGATAGFLKDVENAVITVSSAGAAGGARGAGGGASLMDYGSNMNLNA